MKLQLVLYIVFGALLAASLSCKKQDIEIVPKIFGHGGISLSPERGVYPNNSEKAILYALDVLAADGVEVDVQLTKDNVPVLFHNPFLDKTIEVYTEGEDCINELTWSELEEYNKNINYPIVTLADMIGPIMERNKLVHLDLKHYNYCTESFVDFSEFNSALMENFTVLSVEERKRITVNSRSIDLLNAIADTLIEKSFETEDIDLGISYHELLKIDKITTKLSVFTDLKSKQLKSSGVPFCLYQVKTKKDIKTAAAFQPNEIITDNIAATNKYYK